LDVCENAEETPVLKRECLAVMVAVLACVMSASGCENRKDAKVTLDPPDWDILSDPGAVVALDETDPQGDHLGYGLVADWSVLRGTCDAQYAYIHADVYSSPLLDDKGGVRYRLVIDANGSGAFDAGDYVAWYNLVEGFIFENHNGSPIVVGEAFRLNPDGGIDLAIPAYRLSRPAFGVLGIMHCWDGLDWTDGDRVPDSGGMAVFSF
jgi:hypothetical protein